MNPELETLIAAAREAKRVCTSAEAISRQACSDAEQAKTDRDRALDAFDEARNTYLNAQAALMAAL